MELSQGVVDPLVRFDPAEALEATHPLHQDTGDPAIADPGAWSELQPSSRVSLFYAFPWRSRGCVPPRPVLSTTTTLAVGPAVAPVSQAWLGATPPVGCDGAAYAVLPRILGRVVGAAETGPLEHEVETVLYVEGHLSQPTVLNYPRVGFLLAHRLLLRLSPRWLWQHLLRLGLLLRLPFGGGLLSFGLLWFKLHMRQLMRCLPCRTHVLPHDRLQLLQQLHVVIL
mmetsp:Transcript_102440/g.316110  ORF Transcript_102440/g.316110 Transcript_102440/m.316110 type:complete len:226 (+) Transcript_102440:431-1108(+)